MQLPDLVGMYLNRYLVEPIGRIFKYIRKYNHIDFNWSRDSYFWILDKVVGRRF